MHRKIFALTVLGLIALSLIIISAPTQSYGQTSSTPTPDLTSTPEATSEFTSTATFTPVPEDGDVTPVDTPAEVPTSTPTATEVPVDRYFPETGFTVPAVFMKFWQANGALGVFGYPISEARTETNPNDGKDYTVQYFERNRFEYHPEHADTPNEVQLGLLGAELTSWRTFPTAEPFTSTDTAIYFPETQHSLSEPFLSYWVKTGGLGVFGYPISEQFTEKSATDGKNYTVQYFQRNRLEYHPENIAPYDVLLGLLGHDALEIEDASTAWGTPVPGGQPVVRGVWPPAKPAVGQTFLQGPTVGDGMVAQLYYQDIDRNLNMLNDLKFKWVTQQVEWKDTETPKGVYYFNDLDKIVDAAQAHNVKIMLSVVKAPTWETGGFNGLPKDPKDMYDFMKALATHYSGRVSAYMIYNEVNLIGESGDINPGRYVEVLKQGYLGVKAGDPHAIVLSAALAPTGVQDPNGKNPVVTDLYYLEEMYKYNNGEVRRYFDVLGTHPYGFNNPPETKWPDDPNLNPAFPYNTKKQQVDWYNLDDSFYFRRIEEQRAIMEKYGDGPKQMWVTEYGWCSDYRPDGYGECKYNTLQQQGDYIVRAIDYAHKYYPWMGVMFLWNLNFSTFQDWYTGPSHFSILNPDWTGRPAYFALKNRPDQ
ncbi:MAG TPA: hypothetical protein VLQ48_11985 [Chloroflexia bacterium]|nr:hypothetical protein [Chloroflexia bacterium]